MSILHLNKLLRVIRNILFSISVLCIALLIFLYAQIIFDIGLFDEELSNGYVLSPINFNANNIALYDPRGNMIIEGGVGLHIHTDDAIYGQNSSESDSFFYFYIDHSMEKPRFFIGWRELANFCREKVLTQVNEYNGRLYWGRRVF